MLEADFAISCSQCGGEDFQEVFPVPAETYHFYGEGVERQRPHVLTASVYACLQCGHLEKFVDLPTGPSSDLDAESARDHFDPRG
ncbi:MAG: hypothetical protein QGH25_15585 [Candidatus Latescibacteria bacterium]|nr:hypothetical protein [Candidatus Latescibacterota bacterium]